MLDLVAAAPRSALPRDGKTKEWRWHKGCDTCGVAYEDQHVPRGTSRRWEVILADEERTRDAPRLRALDVRGQHAILRPMSEDDLARIPLTGAGEGLARYKAYLDLHDPGRADFLAEGSEVVKPGQRIVAKADVSRDIWDRLIESAHDVVGRGRRRTA